MSATQVAVFQEPIKKMMRRKPLLPHKLIDRLGLPGEVRVPATFEDWIELSVDCEYRVEYRNGHVISIFDTDSKTNETMGQATLTHEQLVANIILALGPIISHKLDCILLGSNMPTFVEDGKAVVNPDISIVKGTPTIIRYKHRKKTQNTLTNPCIVVEVLSQGTRNYDLVEKKNDYFKVPSVEQIIFVEQYYWQVMSYTRQENKAWLYLETSELSGSLPVFDGEIKLGDIYKKVTFPS
jgi:Uma2 family endonuclease